MNKQMVAIVAVAGIVVACAPASNTPANPAATGSAPANQQQLPPGHVPISNPAPPAQATKPALSDIKKADQTVADIYAGKDTLGDTVVNVRGKVVKYNAQIMGKNWVHVQDGSGSSGTNDLMVTTPDTAKVGDIVLVSGKITRNKDFGSGYKYALILEDAKITVEAK